MNFRRLGVVTAALLWAAGPVLAHHSTAMFDKKKQATTTGVVSEYQWTNPHVFIEVDVVEGGKRVRYSIEGGTTRTMEKHGWKVRSLKPGDRVTVVHNPFRNGEPGGLLVRATLPDGKSLSYDPG